MKEIKGLKGQEGKIKAKDFWFLNRKWIIAKSDTKWHAGEKYKRAPIWFSHIDDRIPALFIGKLAIGYEKNK